MAARSFQLFRSIRSAQPRQRLWLAGIGLGMFLLTIVIGNQFIARDKAVTRQMLGHDFLAFYTAGSFVREGRYRDLYKLDAVKNFEQFTAHAANLEVGKSFGPWWNPPFYALIFQPLAGLPYAQALDLWRWISLAAVILAIGLLTLFVARVCNPCERSTNRKYFNPESSPTPQAFNTGYKPVPRWSSWRNWALVPMLVLVSMPFIQSFSHGQNTFTSLLLLTATVSLWRAERKLFAGMVAGLLFYKPQLAAVVAAVMVFDLGLPALAGLTVTGISLLLITVIQMPGSLSDFVHLLPANVHWMQVEQTYLWERHVTLKAFWRLLLQGREAGEATLTTQALTYLSMAIIGGALLVTAIRHRNTGSDPIKRDRLIAATIAVMPLLMPFYFDYDLLLLAVPLALYAAERVHRPELTTSTDRSLTQTAVALFLWLFFNPGVAFRAHLNVTVLLLFAVAAFLVERAARDESQQSIRVTANDGLRMAA